MMEKSSNFLVIAILLIFLGGKCFCPASAQVNAQNINSAQKAETLMETANIIPEAVKIPPPPAIALPNQSEIVDTPPAQPLAWRAKALALANEYPLKDGSIVWVLPVKYVKGQSLLRQAIDRIGLVLVSEYLESGQFLLSIPEANNKAQIIVISQPVGDNKTLFKMHIYGSGRLTDAKRAGALPETMKSLLDNTGLWQ